MPLDYSSFKCKPLVVPFVELRVGDEFIVNNLALGRVEERTEEHLVMWNSNGFVVTHQLKDYDESQRQTKYLVVHREHPDVTLYRPVGDKELALIKELGRFPPRLPDQLIFYPVTNEQYAWEIAEIWNQRDGVHVVRFTVRGDVLARYPVRTVGRSYHKEHWVPAEELEAFNTALTSPIEEIQRDGPR